MENRSRENSNMVNVPISDTIDRGELFGGLDKNLKLIEDNFKVDIIPVSYTHLDVYKRQY